MWSTIRRKAAHGGSSASLVSLILILFSYSDADFFIISNCLYVSVCV